MTSDYRDGVLAASTPVDWVEPDGDDDVAGADGQVGASSDDVEVRSAIVPASHHAQRLDKWLVEMATEFSRAHLQRLLAGGHVRLDGAVADSASRKLRAGQRVDLALWPTAESQAFKAEPMALPIVYEDDDLLVVDKPAGLVVHPAAGHWSGTLLNGLLAHHAGAAALPRAGIVHRLDKDTSGLMVVGKRLAAVTALSRAIAAREVKRVYHALVNGALPEGRFRVDAPIGRDPRSRVKMAVVAHGRPAQTDVERLGSDGVSSAVRCSLHTGRTHQIRVHLASRGHPLVADPLYGGVARHGLTRQALHAVHLAFAHPSTGLMLSLESELPPDLAGAWQQVMSAPADW